MILKRKNKEKDRGSLYVQMIMARKNLYQTSLEPGQRIGERRGGSRGREYKNLVNSDGPTHFWKIWVRSVAFAF